MYYNFTLFFSRLMHHEKFICFQIKDICDKIKLTYYYYIDITRIS